MSQSRNIFTEMCMLYLDFLYTGLARGGIRMQKVKKNYAKAAELMIELASLQTSFVTLDDVIKMTNRRVNAIEYGTFIATVTAIAFFSSLLTLILRLHLIHVARIQVVSTCIHCCRQVKVTKCKKFKNIVGN